MKLRPVALFPFLLAAWPPLALAGKNPVLIHDAKQLLLPVAAGCAAAALGWLVAILAGAEPHRRPWAAAASGLGFWGFRAVISILQKSPGIYAIGLHAWSGWLTVGLMAGAAWLLIRRLPPRVAGATRFLNLMSAILVALPLAQLLRSGGPEASRRRTPPAPAFDTLAAGPTGARPDVFLIILDAYTGPRSLQSEYGFDDSHFLDALRERGFVVPERVRASYPHTILSLAALLNWEPVATLVPDLPRDSDDPRELIPYLEENPTWDYFLRRGYRFAFFPSSREITGEHVRATEGFAHEYDDFRGWWVQMSPLPELRRTLQRVRAATTGLPDRGAPLVRDNEARFERVARLRREGAPVFAFVHLLLPHQPLIYRADCSAREPALWAFVDKTLSDSTIKAAYIEQLRCLNTRLLALVDTLRAGPAPEPVIVLVSDHGFRPQYRGVPPLAEVTPAEIAERLEAFGAVLVPPQARSALGAATTPTDLWRGVLREVFALPLPPLGGPSWWSASERPYDLIRLDSVPYPRP